MTAASGQTIGLFFELLSSDLRLQALVHACCTADEVALIAQDYGFVITGEQLLMASGRIEHGVSIERVDHPGEYPGRYY